MTLPANDGDAGQVLSTNGSGVCSWVASGGVPTAITVAVEPEDTECFVCFFTAATGDLGPKTNGGMKFNADTETLSVTNVTATTNLIANSAMAAPTISATDTLISLMQNDTAATCGTHDFRRSRDGTPTYDVSDNDYLGQINFKGYHTDAYYLGASIRAVVNGTPGSSDMPSELIFATSADGSAAPTDRLTIDAAGLVTFSGAVTLGISNSLTCGTIELGHASDTTIARVSAGVVSIEGKNIYLAGGADVSPADGGTGVSNGNNNTITFTGNYALGLTLSNNTSVTLPTSGTLLANVSEDTTPQLGGELDCQAHSIGFTQQTATGDGTTTIN